MKAIWTRATARAAALTTLLLVTAFSPKTFAQAGHSHPTTPQAKELTADQGELLKIVRDNTARFRNVEVAKGEQYGLLFGCVTGDDFGAMGLHFVKKAFLDHPPMLPDGTPDPTQPQIVIYEPVPGGGLKLIGADYLLFADAWDKDHPGVPPQLKGQAFHYFSSPNRFGLPPFYTLHVWAWKDNPLGAFVNWHPDVSCKPFNGQVN